jgi:hypothetical protein
MSTAERSTTVTFIALAMAEYEPCIGATDDCVPARDLRRARADIRRLRKEDEGQDAEALQTAVTGLVYRVQEDLA